MRARAGARQRRARENFNLSSSLGSTASQTTSIALASLPPSPPLSLSRLVRFGISVMEGAREVEESSYAAVHERQTASQPPRADEEKWRKAGKRKRARARADSETLRRTSRSHINPSRSERSLFTVFALSASHPTSPFAPRVSRRISHAFASYRNL
jgi:hypothetical protein